MWAGGLLPRLGKCSLPLFGVLVSGLRCNDLELLTNNDN